MPGGRTWVAADHHFGHKNILNFKDSEDNLLRGSFFKDIEEHDETLIANHNELVDPNDRVYLLGDVCISRRSLHLIGRLNGRLVLATRFMAHVVLGLELENWEICALRTCDTPPCINPEHLFLGTRLENTQDAVVKGRFKKRKK